MEWMRLADLPNQEYKIIHDAIIYWKIKKGKVWHQDRMLKTADIESFEVRVDKSLEKILADHEQQFFGRDKDCVYHAWDKLKNIDRDSFEEIADNYWKDKNVIYCEFETSLRPLKGLSVTDFLYLANGYARDASFAYYWGRPISSCKDPLKLTILDKDHALYASDMTNIYYDGALLKNADPTTWKYLKGDFSGDVKSIFYGSLKLPRVDIETWEYVAGAYSIDKNNVYYMKHRLKGVIPKDWTLLEGSYSKDLTFVYYTNDKLEDADLASFEVLSDYEAKDKHGRFRHNLRT